MVFDQIVNPHHNNFGKQPIINVSEFLKFVGNVMVFTAIYLHEPHGILEWWNAGMLVFFNKVIIHTERRCLTQKNKFDIDQNPEYT
jgi:hypothetical protein